MIWFTYTLQNDYHNKVSYPSLHMITICVCVCVCWEFKTYSLSNFQGHCIALLTTVALLHIRSPENIHLITGSLYPWLRSFHLPHPPSPGNYQSTLCFWEFGFKKKSNITEIIKYLSFSLWLISLSQSPKVSLMLLQVVGFSSF